MILIKTDLSTGATVQLVTPDEIRGEIAFLGTLLEQPDREIVKKLREGSAIKYFRSSLRMKEATP